MELASRGWETVQGSREELGVRSRCQSAATWCGDGAEPGQTSFSVCGRARRGQWPRGTTPSAAGGARPSSQADAGEEPHRVGLEREVQVQEASGRVRRKSGPASP